MRTIALLGIVVSGGCGSLLEGQLAPPDSSAWSHCSQATTVQVTQKHPFIEVSYTEPQTTTDGRPMVNLAHTTIYYDQGAGPIIAKIVPATAPTGGGVVTEKFAIPLGDQQVQSVRICVTGTDSEGREGPGS